MSAITDMDLKRAIPFYEDSRLLALPGAEIRSVKINFVFPVAVENQWAGTLKTRTISRSSNHPPNNLREV
jgi:hypothetical protein